MGSARVLGTYIFAKLMDYPVSFPEAESNHPFRRTEISIQVYKGGFEAEEPATESPAAAGSRESKQPEEADSGNLPATDPMLDTPRAVGLRTRRRSKSVLPSVGSTACQGAHAS